jgi:CrcB protein
LHPAWKWALNHRSAASGKLIGHARAFPGCDLPRRRGRGHRARGARTDLARGRAQLAWTTFAANIAGTAILASLFALVRQRPRVSPYVGPLLGIGLCGALTTFSTLQLESALLVHGGHAELGAGYALGSIAAGLLVATAVGAHARRRPAR